MNVLIVHAHPEPQSFNAAMTHTAVAALTAAGHTVTVSDLYATGFDASSSRRNFATVHDAGRLDLQAEELHASASNGFAADLEAEIARLEAADLTIFQFPLWWFGLPAILKGWVDRVFAKGRIYADREMYSRGRLTGRRGMLSLTTGGIPRSYTPEGYIGDMDAILKPIHRGIFMFVGMDVMAPQVVYGPAKVTAEERQAALDAWAARLHGIAEEAPVEIGRF
ncbi:MAG: NAD(P)H-dependent oxidoreductase [Alphaproteobacteria bacterium]